MGEAGGCAGLSVGGGCDGSWLLGRVTPIEVVRGAQDGEQQRRRQISDSH